MAVVEPEEPSVIEKLLGIRFTSDPRGSRFPLPETPEGHPKGKPYTLNSFVLTREIARDWLTYRAIRRDITPRSLIHPEFRDNRKFLVDYVKEWAKVYLGEGDEKYNPNTHEGAAFSAPDGFLLDAQHRIAGFLLSGLDSIEIPVTRDVSWAAFAIMNKARRRNPAQMLGKIPYSSIATGTARYLLPILDGAERDLYTIPGRDSDVINIARGWPQFRGDLTKEVMIAGKSRIPASPLGAVVIGAHAAGANPFEVQAFIEGLKVGYRDGYPTIGVKGEDPRRLLKLAFSNGERNRRFSDSEQRVNAGMIRRAMEVWLHRNDPKPIELRSLPRVQPHRPLPPVWNAEKVREFHAKHVI